jgi:hypothetical protein
MSVTCLRLITVMMQAVNTSETPVNFYETTQRYNPEDSHLYTRRENLKASLLSDHFILQVRFTWEVLTLWLRTESPGFESRHGRNFSLCRTDSGAHPTGIGVLSRSKAAGA